MGNYKEIKLPIYIGRKEEKIKEIDGFPVVVTMTKGYGGWKKGHLFYDDSWPNNSGFYLVNINSETNKLEKELIQINDVNQLFIEE